MIKILILGPTGSMGTLISQHAFDDEDIDIVAALDIMNVGDELGVLVGKKDPNHVKIRNITEIKEVIDETKPEVAVDFTLAEASEKNCMICVENNIRCVIGTTGLSNSFIEEFEKKVKEYNAPAVISSNMATGVNIFFKMASVLTEYLKDWDIEIIESHHIRKRDNYSGTSLTIAKTICDTLGVEMDDVVKYGRPKGPALRKKGAKNEIGIHCIRAGDIVGDHIILYAGSGERIEFKHQAHSRNCFASGAIIAIKFIADARENKIYNTREVLNL
ncbi:MAG: 4-hydroxy-tetrahydrodipicolinate reductase [Promethearchaeota archaeon]|nr:MAG: 4-hydroxy-tetrahydrodipicolinate reductase [Candidatus Lokiarchaeota archaeon]